MKRISILGCGWLGQSLAQTLLNKGYSVKGSATSPENCHKLQLIGVEAYNIHIKNAGVNGDIDSFVSDTDVLITAFPPGVRRNSKTNYPARIQHLLNSISLFPSCNILHLSSVGVFDATQGEVDETSIPQPKTVVGKQLLEAEKNILSLGNRATIVRLGGLVGNKRHPAKQLAGKKDIPAPYAPTNLIHQKDVVDFLTAIVECGFWGHTLHCVSPQHQQREAFYSQECRENNLPIPHFSSEKSERNKKVLDTKSNSLFSFEYQLAGCRLKDC